MSKIEILMPALSPTMEEGGIAKWLVKPGDTIRAGDLIAEIETDKAIMEFESASDGIICELLVEEGSNQIKVNSPIALISDESFPQKIETLQQNIAIILHLQILINLILNPVILELEEIKEGQKLFTAREAIRDALAEEMRTDQMFF